MLKLSSSAVNKAPIEYTAFDSRKNGTTEIGKASYLPQLSAYSLNSTLFSVTSFLASSVAQVNWRLYTKSKDGNEDSRREVLAHSALVVLNQPNNFATRQDLFEAGQLHQELSGETWWVFERVNGMPVGIWLARPDRMTVVKSKADYLLGYTYRNPDGTYKALDIRDVVQMKTPNPLDDYRGMAPVATLLRTMYTESTAEEYQLHLLANNAMPGGVLTVEAGSSDQEWKRRIQRWNENHGGPQNAGKVAFVEDAKFQTVAFAQRDMQFLEQRGFNEDKIREAYGVSKAMLGVVDDVNRANNDAQQASYAEYKLKPRLEKIKLALNTQFLPQFADGSGYEFDYDDITVEDQEKIIADRDSRIKAAIAIINAGGDPIATMKAFDLPDIPFTKPVAQTGGNDGQVQD